MADHSDYFVWKTANGQFGCRKKAGAGDSFPIGDHAVAAVIKATNELEAGIKFALEVLLDLGTLEKVLSESMLFRDNKFDSEEFAADLTEIEFRSLDQLLPEPLLEQMERIEYSNGTIEYMPCFRTNLGEVEEEGGES